MKYFRQHWFFLGLILMPLLAALSPEMGSKGSFIHPEILNKASIYIIFITSGLSINTRYFIQTTKKLKLHLFVQIFCFVVIPIFMFGFHFFIFSKLPFAQPFKAGLIILACLPTTISSCVVLTRMAKGDSASALFNGVTSNLLGVLISPVLLSLFIDNDATSQLNVISIIEKLIKEVLFPLTMGHLLHVLFPNPVKKYKTVYLLLSSYATLFITYHIFCDTFIICRSLINPLFQISVLTLTVCFLHIFFFLLALMSSRLFSFTNKERISLLFTSPQKTLALGFPLTLILAKNGLSSLTEHSIGFFALPLLLYHHIQLIIASSILPYLRKHLQ